MRIELRRIAFVMIKRFLFVVGYVLALNINAQTVRVINQTNLNPVEDVFVYNIKETHSELSNARGIFEASGFAKEDILVFQHPSYVEYILPYEDLENANFLIKLKEKSVNLNEVVISASKWEQDKSEVPNKITTLDPRKVSIYNVQTTADLLGVSNEVFIQKSQFGGGSPMIRGFAANSVLIVVDGVRMNNAIFRDGNLQNIINIDPNTIGGAEVIFGPGSIIYGSDALGGVMDFHTKQVKLGLAGEAFVASNALARYSSASNENTFHLDVNYGREKWGFLTSITFFNYDDLEMGSNHNSEYIRPEYAERINGHDTIIKNSNPDIQKFSGYKQLNLLQKLRFRPNDKLDIRYGFNYSTTSDIPRYDRLIEYNGDKLKYVSWYYGPQKWMMHNLLFNFSNQSSIFDDARLIIAYQRFEESRHDRRFGNETLRSRYEYVDAITLNLDFDKELSNNQTIFYGIESVYNKVNSMGEAENINTGDVDPVSTRYPDGGSDYSTAAAYMSYKNNLSERVTLTAGARYSYVFLNAAFHDTSFFKFPYSSIKLNSGALNGSLGLVYKPVIGWQFNVSASSGFRAPNIDDIAKVFDSEPGNVIVPNSNLKPEYAYNIDFGLIKRFGKKAKLEITLFYTYLVDAMARKEFTLNGHDSVIYDGELSQVWALQNVGSANIYGGNFAFVYDITGNLTFDSYLTYQKGKDQDNIPVRHVSPLFGSTGLNYTKGKLRIKLYANYNGELSYGNLALSERNKPHLYAKDKNGDPYVPAWWTFNIKASYKVSANIQIDLGLENFFDYRYRTYSSGISAPGRSFMIAIRGSI